MVGQLLIIVFLILIELLELLGIHLADVDAWWQVRSLESLNMKLVLKSAQLVLV